MEDNIKAKIKDEVQKKERKEIASFTLSKDNIQKLKEESEKLCVSGSALLYEIAVFPQPHARHITLSY